MPSRSRTESQVPPWVLGGLGPAPADAVAPGRAGRSWLERLGLRRPAQPSARAGAGLGFRWVGLGLAVGHLAFTVAAGRLRVEHVAADLFIGLTPWLGPRALAFARAALPIWLTGLVIDNQWIWLSLRGAIHTGDLMALETALFPAPGGISWPEWFSARPTPLLDLLAGTAYATYLLEVLAVGIFLFFVAPRRFADLAWAFFAANAIGALIYVLYPAAPPWYVLAYGPGPANLAAAPSAAGAARFDQLLGISYFASFYSRNPNVFGAMPSLHCAYPTLVLLLTWKRGWGWRIGAAAFAVWVAFSAVYLGHHYLLDVFAGAAVATLAVGLVIAAKALFGTPAQAPATPPVLPGRATSE